MSQQQQQQQTRPDPDRQEQALSPWARRIQEAQERIEREETTHGRKAE